MYVPGVAPTQTFQNFGEHYFRSVVEYINRHNIKSFLEIGVDKGKLAVQVKPLLDLYVGVDVVKASPHCSHTMSSDRFFAANEFAHGDFDCCFIDGLHLFETSLRDFVGAEKLVARSDAIIFHDVIPENEVVCARRRQSNPWTGDVYKTIAALLKWRPDLKIELRNAAPSGLAIITQLDPQSMILEQNYLTIVDGFIDYDYAMFIRLLA